MSEDQMYEFKVRDFTRPLIGRMYRDGDARIYYVERGDGNTKQIRWSGLIDYFGLTGTAKQGERDEMDLWIKRQVQKGIESSWD